MNERETKELTRQIEQKELKIKEQKIELFIQENPGLSDDELKEYFSRTSEAKDIFSDSDAFVGWVRHLPKETE